MGAKGGHHCVLPKPVISIPVPYFRAHSSPPNPANPPFRAVSLVLTISWSLLKVLGMRESFLTRFSCFKTFSFYLRLSAHPPICPFIRVPELSLSIPFFPPSKEEMGRLSPEHNAPAATSSRPPQSRKGGIAQPLAGPFFSGGLDALLRFPPPPSLRPLSDQILQALTLFQELSCNIHAEEIPR